MKGDSVDEGVTCWSAGSAETTDAHGKKAPLPFLCYFVDCPKKGSTSSKFLRFMRKTLSINKQGECPRQGRSVETTFCFFLNTQPIDPSLSPAPRVDLICAWMAARGAGPEQAGEVERPRGREKGVARHHLPPPPVV